MAASFIPSGQSTAIGLPFQRRRRISTNSFQLVVRSAAGEGPSAAAEPDLSVKVNGLEMPNPFVIGSGPPGTNYTVMKRAFDEGWGAVIAKTVSLDASKVVNVTPRYARLRAGSNGSAKGQIIGWENIELISDRPLETMLNEFKQLKKEYPDRILVGSIMEEYNKDAWHQLIERVEEAGVDALEINFSCPHGMPERKMGAAVGQDCALLEEVCGWINEKATVPVWAKMTPNITDITQVNHTVTLRVAHCFMQTSYRAVPNSVNITFGEAIVIQKSLAVTCRWNAFGVNSLTLLVGGIVVCISSLLLLLMNELHLVQAFLCCL